MKRSSPDGQEGRENKKFSREKEKENEKEKEKEKTQVIQPTTPAITTMEQTTVSDSHSVERVVDTYQESMEVLPFYPRQEKEEDEEEEQFSEPPPVVKKLVDETQDDPLKMIKKKSQDRVRFEEPVHLREREIVIVPDTSPPKTKQNRARLLLNPRKKSDRERMEGVDCDECKNFYDAMGDDENRKSHLNRCSKHRVLEQRPSTPPDFWDMNFPQRN